MRKPGSFFKVYRIEILTLNSIYDFKKLCDVFISQTRNKKLEIVCEFYFHNIVKRHFPI